MKEMMFYYRGHLIYPYSGFDWRVKDFNMSCRGGISHNKMRRLYCSYGGQKI